MCVKYLTVSGSKEKNIWQFGGVGFKTNHMPKQIWNSGILDSLSSLYLKKFSFTTESNAEEPLETNDYLHHGLRRQLVNIGALGIYKSLSIRVSRNKERRIFLTNGAGTTRRKETRPLPTVHKH